MRIAPVLGTLAIATLVSAPALADCVPGTGLCASVGAAVPGVQANGQITIGIPPFFGPPQAPPPAAPPPPPAPPAYAPPPVYVYPQYAYPQPPPPRYVVARPDWSASKLGIDLRVDGAAGIGTRLHPSYGLGGAGLGLRYRATPHFGIDLGLDVLGGRDYNDDKRLEVAGSLGGLLYFNPRSRVQLYMSAGFLADHAKASPTVSPIELATASGDLTYDHVGGYAGLGLEFFATRHLAFHLDAKGLVREKVGGTPGPEFTDPNTGKTTNTSGGIVGQGGMVFYF